MEITLSQQYNVGEKPTVILYIYINRHAGTPEKHQKQNRDNVVHITHGSSLKKNIVVPHIQRIGCQPGKTSTLYTVANPARGLLSREKEKEKEKVQRFEKLSLIYFPRGFISFIFHLSSIN